MGFTLDQPWQIIGASMLAGRARLKLEVQTGLKSSTSTLQIVKRNWGVKSNTKAGALLEMDAFKMGWDLGLDFATGKIETTDELQARGLAERRAFKGRKRLLQEAAYERGYEMFVKVAQGQR